MGAIFICAIRPAGGRHACMSRHLPGNEPKSGLVRDLGGRLQFRNVSVGTFGDLIRKLCPQLNKILKFLM